MRTTILTIAAVACAFGLQARIAETSSPQPLLKGVQSDLYNPILSVDGQQLLYSSSDYSNLRLYDFRDNVSVTISKEGRSGFHAQFSPDGTQVVFVSQSIDASGVNMRQLKSYDIARRSVTSLSRPARRIERPVVGDGGVNVSVDGRLSTFKKMPQNGVRTSGSTLYITRAGKETAYQPVKSEAGYLWASISPDGDKVMFYAAGHGIVITDLDGNILGEPGNYECPVWYGNDIIVAMNATDDGHQFRSSQIVMLRADGSEIQELTRPESMSMNPTVSFEAGKIVYNTIDGRLYQLNVTLKH